jgi:hypothetical protein
MKARPTRNPPSTENERKMAKNLGHIESLARSYTDTAIKTLAGIMMEPSAPARARIAAAAILLDRGWGKPKENVELPDAEPRQITHIVREIVHLPPGGVQLDMEPADEPEPVLIWRSNGKNGAD